MNMFRIALAAALSAVALGSVAQAQTRPEQPAATDFYAVQEGRSVATDVRASAYRGAPVPASVSHTVMGLSTPY